MTITDIDLWSASRYEYEEKNYSLIGQRFPNILHSQIVASTKNNAANKNYEAQGLQATLIEIQHNNGNIEYVIAARGSSDTKDFVTDAGLNDPNAYKTNSQFSDFEDFINMCQKEYHIDPSKVTYTGHSLGGGLASFAAVRFNGKATVYSAPSAYNQLNLNERSKVEAGKYDSKIKNIKHANDMVPEVPALVPKIGKQIYTNNNNKLTSDIGTNLLWFLNLEGHMTETYGPGNFDKNGGIISESSILGKGEHIVTNMFTFGGLINTLAVAASAAAQGGSFLSNPSSAVISLEIKSVNGAINMFNSVKEPLKSMKKVNDNIYPDMEEGFEQATIMAAAMPYISSTDVDDIVDRHRLKPEDNVDTDLISDVDKLIDQQITDIDALNKALADSAASLEENDSNWATTLTRAAF